MIKKSNNKKKAQTQKPKEKVIVIQTQKAPVKQKAKNTTLGNIAQTVGNLASAYTGIPGIGTVAKKLGNNVARIFGSGDYITNIEDVKENSIITKSSEPPRFNNTKGGTIVRHREYVCDIYSGASLVNGSTPFNTLVFSINPGLLTLFPWLSDVALSFEEWRALGIVFEFKSMSPDVVVQQALGTVILSTQYNANAAAFTNKQQQENYEFAQSVKPSRSCLHLVECAPNQTPNTKLYVRDNATILPDNDLRLSDIGVFQISTVGCPFANANLGELWVSYEIELMKPRLPIGGVTGESLSYHLSLAGVDGTHQLGSIANPSPNTGSSLALSVNITNGPQILFPPLLADGLYMFTVSAVWSVAFAATLSDPTTFVNCALVALLNNNTNTIYSYPPNGTTTLSILKQFVVRITGQGASFKVNGGGSYPLVATFLSGDLFCISLDPLQG